MGEPTIDPNEYAKTRGFSQHEGSHFVWAVEAERWATVGALHRSGQCFMFSKAHGRCQSDAVAALFRGEPGKRGAHWWFYCEDHLYGRVVHDDAVWTVALRPDEPVGGT